MSVYNNLCPSTSNTWNASSLCATRSQKMASLQTLSLECSLATTLPLLSLVLPFCRSCPCDVQTQPPTAKSKWLHPSSTSRHEHPSFTPATSHLWFANPRHVSHWLVYVASKTWCTLKACQTYQRNSTPIEQWNVVKLALLPWHCCPGIATPTLVWVLCFRRSISQGSAASLHPLAPKKTTLAVSFCTYTVRQSLSAPWIWRHKLDFGSQTPSCLFP